MNDKENIKKEIHIEIGQDEKVVIHDQSIYIFQKYTEEEIEGFKRDIQAECERQEKEYYDAVASWEREQLLS